MEPSCLLSDWRSRAFRSATTQDTNATEAPRFSRKSTLQRSRSNALQTLSDSWTSKLSMISGNGPGDQVRKRTEITNTSDMMMLRSCIRWSNPFSPIKSPIPSTIIKSPIHFCGSRYPEKSGSDAIIHSAIGRVQDVAIPRPTIRLTPPNITRLIVIFLTHEKTSLFPRWISRGGYIPQYTSDDKRETFAYWLPYFPPQKTIQRGG